MAPADFVGAPQRTIMWSAVAAIVLAFFVWPPLGRTAGLLARIAWLYVLTGAQG